MIGDGSGNLAGMSLLTGDLGVTEKEGISFRVFLKTLRQQRTDAGRQAEWLATEMYID